MQLKFKVILTLLGRLLPHQLSQQTTRGAHQVPFPVLCLLFALKLMPDIDVDKSVDIDAVAVIPLNRCQNVVRTRTQVKNRTDQMYFLHWGSVHLFRGLSHIEDHRFRE